MLDENLIARVYTVDNDGYDRVGTGYPLTEDLLLTALHVVDYPQMNKAAGLEVVWPECDYEKSRLDDGAIVYRGGEDQQFDVALVRCKTPLSEALNIHGVNPPHNSNFICRGYPLAGQHNSKPKHDPIRFSGNTEGNHQDKRLELTTNTTPREPEGSARLEGWSGLSGAPVIVGSQLVGVMSTRYAPVDKRLFAVSLPYLLAHCQQFAEFFPQDSFHQKIREQIAAALGAKGMDEYTRVLCEELNHVLEKLGLDAVATEPKAVAEGLMLALQHGGKDCLVINDAFQGAMFRCFDPEEEQSVYEKTSADLKAIAKGIDNILGYFVLTLVNPQDAKVLHNWLGDMDFRHYYFELNVRTLGGVELFIAYEQGREARIDLDSKNEKLEGKHLIFTKTTPFGWSKKAKLQETQLEVWNTIKNDENRKTVLSADELEELRAIIRQRAIRRRDKENYCLVMEFESDNDGDYTQQCADFLRDLQIPMVRYKAPDNSKEPFYGLEQPLITAVTDFLTYFNEYRDQ